MSGSDSDRTAAFVKLLTKHQWAIEGYLMALVSPKADVDDLMQEVGLAIWNKFDQYDSSRKFLPWACGIAYIEVLRLRRKRARDPHWFSETLLETLSSEICERVDLMQQRRDALGVCLQKLPPSDRETVQKRYYEGQSVDQLASESDTPSSTIYKRLTRIRRALHSCITSQIAFSGGPA